MGPQNPASLLWRNSLDEGLKEKVEIQLLFTICCRNGRGQLTRLIEGRQDTIKLKTLYKSQVIEAHAFQDEIHMCDGITTIQSG